ncbi:hypothetical protein CC86DRAFT_12183 [Ophiobolus disseminans]|uniref:Uncharacterized protein n=1 Tax=Ophiobolus disseminans TaxID=1469910 RepID=A0A6A7ALV2_9PLEO|nr:hypothetical protein CC86DRAFT_12183 [Ophiobolus disseminans]
MSTYREGQRKNRHRKPSATGNFKTSSITLELMDTKPYTFGEPHPIQQKTLAVGQLHNPPAFNTKVAFKQLIYLPLAACHISNLPDILRLPLEKREAVSVSTAETQCNASRGHREAVEPEARNLTRAMLQSPIGCLTPIDKLLNLLLPGWCSCNRQKHCI